MIRDPRQPLDYVAGSDVPATRGPSPALVAGTILIGAIFALGLPLLAYTLGILR